ncbi:MAG: hypothetical protein AB1765_02965 [Candidatus Hydrogenedentota bacterium]
MINNLYLWAVSFLKSIDINISGYTALFLSFFFSSLLIWYYTEKKKLMLETEREIKRISTVNTDFDSVKKDLHLLLGLVNKLEEQQKFLLRITVNLYKRQKVN